jgi:hypothetical protein
MQIVDAAAARDCTGEGVKKANVAATKHSLTDKE